MGKDFMTESYLKLYLYGISGLNIVLGLLFILFASLPKRSGVFESVVLQEGSTSCNLTLATGIILLFVSFTGIIATFLANPRLLFAVCIVTTVVIIMEFAMLISIFISLLNYKWDTHIEYNEMFSNYYTNQTVKEHIDKMQSQGKCCGVDGPDFWKGNFTKSCCQDPKADKCKPWYRGCVKRPVGSVGEYLKRVALALCTIGIIQIFSVMCASKFKKIIEKGPVADIADRRGEQTQMPLTESNKDTMSL